jgi:hypothetical protein
MAQSRQMEQRLLDDSEKELVDGSRHPTLNSHSDEDLAKLRVNLRDRRDRARDIANRQRREMRGKVKPAASRAAGNDAGSREKFGVLSSALQRVNKEITRRKQITAREELKQNAEKALEMRRAASAPHRPSSRRTSKGMRAVPNERGPDLVNRNEVGRISQFVKSAQARRDTK